MKPMASKLKTMRWRSASDFITGTNWKFRYSFQTWKVVTKKS